MEFGMDAQRFSHGFSYCVPQEKSEVLQAVHRSNPHVPGKTLFHVISVLVEV